MPRRSASASSGGALDRRLDRLHLHLEFGVLPFQALDAVALREGHLDGGLVARLGSAKLLLEAGDELAGAQHQLRVLGRAALERDAVDAADEIDGQLIAILGLGVLAGALLVNAALLGELGEGLVHFGFTRRVDRPGKLEPSDVDRFEIRHDRNVQLIGEVLLAGDHFVHVGLRRQVRRGGDAEVVFGDHLLAGLVERLLDHLAHQGLAVDAPHVRWRHLAGPEAAQIEPRRDLSDLGLELLAQLVESDADAVDPAEPVARNLRHLHRLFQPRRAMAGLAQRL